MKTLIIHPKDRSTWFLDITYKKLPDVTLVTGDLTKSQVLNLISTHDRVMMMGHGSPGGLFCVGQFRHTQGFIIDDSAAELLKGKKDSVFFWCHADQFVRKHGLSGFSTGMFISEVGEADWCRVLADQRMVDESNFLFMEEAALAMAASSKDLHKQVTTGKYADLAKKNPAAAYNHERLYFFP